MPQADPHPIVRFTPGSLPELRVHMRLLLVRDRPDVRAIAAAAGSPYADGGRLAEVLRRRNVIGIVAEFHGHVVGFMVYEIHSRSFDLLDLAVHPEVRRLGIGRRMMERLKVRLRPDQRTGLTATVRESALGGHLFLRATGWRAVGVVGVVGGRDEGTGEDGYEFVYRLGN